MALSELTLHAAGLIRARVEALGSEAADAEAIHDRRVASRRLRVACELFEPLLPDAPLRRCAKRLKEQTRALGGTRELDVHLALLQQLLDGAREPVERAAIEHLQEWAEERRRKSAKRAEKAAEGKGLKELAKELLQIADALEGRLDPTSTPAFSWSSLHPRLLAGFGPLAGLCAGEDPEPMHATRTCLKQLRYALEYMEPAFHDGFQDLLATTRGLQDALGHHHDQVVLCELIQSHRKALAARNRGALLQGLESALQRARLRRQELYQSFRAATPRVSTDALSQSLWVGIGPLQALNMPAHHGASPQA